MPAHSPSARLFAAIKAKDLAAVKTAIALGVDLNDKGRGGEIPLEEALLAGHEEVVAALLAAGSCVRDPDEALHLAINGGSLKVLEQMLNIIKPEDCVEAYGTYTPLMRSAYMGRIDMCKLLLEHGSDPRLCNAGGWGVLSYALSNAARNSNKSSNSILKLVGFLLEKGVPIQSAPSAETTPPLIDAIDFCVAHRHFDGSRLGKKLCMLLIEAGADLNATYYDSEDFDGGTVLHHIAVKGNRLNGDPIFTPDLVPFLVKSGAFVNSKNSAGATPLHCASMSGNVTPLQQFLDCAAEVNALDNEGRSPLHFAAGVASVRLLLAAGANPAIIDSSGATAEVCASRDNNNSKVHAFLKALRHQTELNDLTLTANTFRRTRI